MFRASFVGKMLVDKKMTNYTLCAWIWYMCMYGWRFSRQNVQQKNKIPAPRNILVIFEEKTMLKLFCLPRGPTKHIFCNFTNEEFVRLASFILFLTDTIANNKMWEIYYKITNCRKDDSVFSKKKKKRGNKLEFTYKFKLYIMWLAAGIILYFWRFFFWNKFD
jgi:hypothetical protein